MEGERGRRGGGVLCIITTKKLGKLRYNEHVEKEQESCRDLAVIDSTANTLSFYISHGGLFNHPKGPKRSSPHSFQQYPRKVNYTRY